jgi:heme/copper-type cytochrome/quinol oxidase subunit 2
MYNQAGVALGMVVLVLLVFLYSMLCYRAFNGSMAGWSMPVLVSTCITVVAVVAIGIITVALEQ